MRITYLKIGIFLSVCLLLMSSILPSIVYANEVSNIQTIQSEIDWIDAKLSQNYLLTEQEIKDLVEDSKGVYPDISDERKIELLEMVSSKYAARASFLDGQGITVDEMAWIIRGIVNALIGRYIKLGAYAAKYGISMARSILSRVAATAAARVGLSTKISGWILRIAVNVADVYGNFAYNIAAAWDAHDKIPNNGRINF